MKLASLIHQSRVQILPRLGSGISRARSSSVSIIIASSSLCHAASFSSSSDGIYYCRKHLARLKCFNEKNQEGLEFEEEMQNKAKEATSDSSANYQNVSINRNSSVRTVTLCVLAAVAFGLALGLKDGPGKASEYFAGYILEQSLSVDNIFVFVLIFKYFKVPSENQSRVLSYGIVGAVIFRAVIIMLGTASIKKFEAVNILLALILLFSSYKLFSADGEETDLADNFIVRTCQKFIPVTAYYDDDRFLTTEDGVWKATPLLLTIAVIELSDIAFAIDSIPAVFGVTRDPFIVYSSNLFAILGLRSLYALISESMAELEYLQPAIGIVLGFIGTKMIFDYFGYHISIEVSLGFVFASLSTAVLLSLKNSNSQE